MVVAIGLHLVRRRWPRGADGPHPVPEPALAGAAHHHAHSHDNHHHAHAHSHGGRPHTHALPAGGITARGVVAMGVSGGLVPCPEALGVMIVAVGAGRALVGLGLIVSFSLGLAAVLMGLGVLLLRSRRLAARFGRAGGRWAARLPLISALVVTALGAGLLVRAVGLLP
ncbi:urease accessory protein UreH domain-containing protein [Symbioplanes lichenis]|uniref:urease accessory protein UreH domain-containing protein n=1 Tax=Symbioplanes lichenis TaxID=1629072 RepID=UPI002738D502|nr:sulfite exporter TauE/SafE family protein [Actinoplanes lichenis]